MFNWIQHFQSDKDVHGLAFASERACKKGIPLSLVIGALRVGLIK